MIAQDRPRYPCVNSGADYTDEEREFMLAMEKYMRENRRPYPTWSEVLAVTQSLGYRRVEPPRGDNGKTA